MMRIAIARSAAARVLSAGLLALLTSAGAAAAQDASHKSAAPLPGLDGVDLTGAPSRGAADSPVTLVMFTDFGNPGCANAGVILQGLLDIYPERLRIVFKHTLPEHRADRMLAQEAALAAGDQGKFWPMHDLLLANQGRQQMADLLAMAAQLELDVPRFSAALEAGTFRAAVEQDRLVADTLQIRNQPTWFLNGVRIPGPITLADLQKRIDAVMPADR